MSSENAPLISPAVVLYPRRWYMLLSFSLAAFLNNAIFVSFAPIANGVHDFFGVSFFWVNALSWVTVVADCVLAIPSIWFIQRFGCGTMLRICSCLHLAGCLVRYLGSFSADRQVYFILLLIGQTLVAIAQPALNAAPPQVSGDWFGEQERSVATAIASTCSLVGLGAGYALFAFAVGENMNLLWIGSLTQLCLAAVIMVMSLFYQTSPPTPSSLSQQAEGGTFARDIRLVASNPSFILLTFIFSLPFGLFIAVWSTLEEILGPSHLPDLDILAGALGCVMIGGGIVGSLVLARIMDRYRRSSFGKWYSRSVWLTVTCTPLAFIGLHLCVRFQTGVAPIYVLGVVAGAVSIALLPACIETAVEITYPATECNSGGVLLAVSNVIGTVYILALTFVDNILTSFLAVTLSCLISVVALFFFKPRYLRLEAEGQCSSVAPLNSMQ